LLAITLAAVDIGGLAVLLASVQAVAISVGRSSIAALLHVPVVDFTASLTTAVFIATAVSSTVEAVLLHSLATDTTADAADASGDAVSVFAGDTSVADTFAGVAADRFAGKAAEKIAGKAAETSAGDTSAVKTSTALARCNAVLYVAFAVFERGYTCSSCGSWSARSSSETVTLPARSDSSNSPVVVQGHKIA
jgi:hypothetical protein